MTYRILAAILLASLLGALGATALADEDEASGAAVAK